MRNSLQMGEMITNSHTPVQVSSGMPSHSPGAVTNSIQWISGTSQKSTTKDRTNLLFGLPIDNISPKFQQNGAGKFKVGGLSESSFQRVALSCVLWSFSTSSCCQSLLNQLTNLEQHLGPELVSGLQPNFWERRARFWSSENRKETNSDVIRKRSTPHREVKSGRGDDVLWSLQQRLGTKRGMEKLISSRNHLVFYQFHLYHA